MTMLSPPRSHPQMEHNARARRWLAVGLSHSCLWLLLLDWDGFDLAARNGCGD
jgi:hypothetical protein